MSRKSNKPMPDTSLPTANSGNRRIILRLLLAAAVLGAVVWGARDSGAEIAAFESWIAGFGWKGMVVFTVAAVFLMAVFVPSSILGTLAGALFGLAWGSLAMAVAGIVTAALTYQIAGRLLRDRIASFLKGYPKLRAIQRAVLREGLRLQFMLRLAPINAVSVNYVLGAAAVRFPSFMVASLGMLPGLFIEVYFGHLAKHATKVAGGVGSHSSPETLIKVGGFLATAGVLVVVGRMAQKAIARADPGDG